MQVILGDRQSGKTTTLLDWLVQGRPRPSWPNWDRVIVTADARRARQIVERLGQPYQVRLRDQGGPFLAKLILAGENDYQVLRRLHLHDVAVGLDDAEEWFLARFGVVPTVVAMTGQLYHAD